MHLILVKLAVCPDGVTCFSAVKFTSNSTTLVWSPGLPHTAVYRKFIWPNLGVFPLCVCIYISRCMQVEWTRPCAQWVSYYKFCIQLLAEIFIWVLAVIFTPWQMKSLPSVMQQLFLASPLLNTSCTNFSWLDCTSKFYHGNLTLSANNKMCRDLLPQANLLF